VVSPFAFSSFSQSGNINRQTDLYCPESARNPLSVELPKLLWTEKLDRPSENGLAGSDTHLLGNLMSIWSEEWINRSMGEGDKGDSGFGFLRLMNSSPGEAVKRAKAHPLVSLLKDSEGEREALETKDIAR
jgi:DNA helicase INO80